MRFGLLASLLAFFLALGVAGTAFAGPGLGDSDGDGWDDVFDNCTNDANASQLDVDADGCGNLCDADYNQDAAVDGSDFFDFRGGFLGTASGITDHTGDGTTDGADFFVFRGQFLAGVPGPSLNSFRDLTACP